MFWYLLFLFVFTAITFLYGCYKGYNLALNEKTEPKEEKAKRFLSSLESIFKKVKDNKGEN